MLSTSPLLRRSLLARAAAFLLACGTLAQAQSVSTLVPERFELAPGGTVDLRLHREDAGARAVAAWPTEDVRWLYVRVAGTQRNYETCAPARKELDFVRLPVERAGIALIGLDLHPRLERVTPKHLRAFLEDRAAPGPRPVVFPAREREAPPLLVRRYESTKLLVRVVDERGWLPSSADAQGKSGQRAEIRPLADPTAVRVNRDLPVRVYFPPGCDPVARVIARHTTTGRTQSFLTDRGGTGHFTVDEAGIWTVEAHGARLLANDPQANWELHTATLVFEVPPGPDDEGAAKRKEVIR